MTLSLFRPKMSAFFITPIPIFEFPAFLRLVYFISSRSARSSSLSSSHGVHLLFSLLTSSYKFKLSSSITVIFLCFYFVSNYLISYFVSGQPTASPLAILLLSPDFIFVTFCKHPGFCTLCHYISY